MNVDNLLNEVYRFLKQENIINFHIVRGYLNTIKKY